jgi:hypothetical protein
VFKTPYTTTPCLGYTAAVAGIRAELARALIQGELTLVSTASNQPVNGVFEVPPYVKSIPPYTHPLPMEPESYSTIPRVVVDTRAFTKSDENRVVTAASGQQSDLEFFRLYARLTHRWGGGYVNDFKHLGQIAPTMFIRWLAGSVGSKLNLTPFDLVGVTAITGYYFYCQFLDADQVTEAEKLKIAQQVARATSIPPNKVLEYIDRATTTPVCITTYVKALQEAVDTTRFDKFSPGLIYQIIGGHWWGAHAREVVAVALEFPPAFYAMLFSAFTNKGVRRSIFATQALRVARGDEGNQFAMALARFIEV